MRFGLALPHYDTSYAGRAADWDSIVSLARLAESSGYDSVWVSDHFFLDWSKYGGPSDPQGSFECWTTMAALASATERVHVGSLVLCNDFRNPALVAKMAATLHLLSNGRLELGLGAGWYEAEYRSVGIPLDPPVTRIRRLGEAVEVIKRLLGGEELTFTGDHYEMNGAICRPTPSDPPTVWMGGKGDLLLRTAARVADGWNMSWVTGVDAYRERKDYADRSCERFGRDPSTLQRSVGAYVLSGSDESDLRRRYERLAERSPKGVISPAEGGAGLSWETFRSQRIAGTKDEVVETLGRLGELGVEEVIVGLGAVPFQVADAEDVEYFGNEIAAMLR